MFTNYAFSLFLLVLSAALLVAHRRSWLAARGLAPGQGLEQRHALSQYRRRTQASGMIALLGIGIGLGPLVPNRPLPYTLYLGVLLGACLGLVLLAVLDAWATRQHYRRLRSAQMAAQIKLALELQTVGDRSNMESAGTALE